MQRSRILAAGLLLLAVAPLQSHAKPLRFAVIGDFGKDGDDNENLKGVAKLVKSWRPLEALLSVGDNNYSDGEQSTVEANVGQHFHEFMFPYKSYKSPPAYSGAKDRVNRFFTSPGNHDWGETNLANYLDYYAALHNKSSSADSLTGKAKNGARYFYSKRFGPGNGVVEFFFQDSNRDQDDDKMFGNTLGSKQAQWLQAALKESKASWKFVIQHHSPWCSGDKHGSIDYMQWNTYHTWGAQAVLAGHDHSYERVVRPEGKCQKFPFTVNGLGGASVSGFESPVSGSVVRYNSEWGAQMITVDTNYAMFQFRNTKNQIIDCYKLVKAAKTAADPCGFKITACGAAWQPIG